MWNRLTSATQHAREFARSGSERAQQTYGKVVEKAVRQAKQHKLDEKMAEFATAARTKFEGARETAKEWVKDHPGQAAGAGSGTAIGALTAVLLGGGGIGVVALGGAIGLPLIAVTALVGLLAGERSGRELDVVLAQWSSAKGRIDEAKTGSHLEIRRLTGEQHRQVLEEALVTARRTLCIRSGFLSSNVVDADMLDRIAAAIGRNVVVIIEYGRRLPLQDKLGSVEVEWARAHAQAETSLGELKARLDQQGKGRLLQYGATWTYIKELAVDDEWLVVGSFNWLSNARGSRDESSIRFTDAELARQVRDETQTSLKQLG